MRACSEICSRAALRNTGMRLDAKSRDWFKNLICIWMKVKNAKTLQIMPDTPYGCGEQDIIAVPYNSIHTPGFECDRNRGYTAMLEKFGRFDIQYRFQHDARKRAISPRIFADMQWRNLDRPFDRLPIVAKSCQARQRP
jgi:hypothetical protein